MDLGFVVAAPDNRKQTAGNRTQNENITKQSLGKNHPIAVKIQVWAICVKYFKVHKSSLKVAEKIFYD